MLGHIVDAMPPRVVGTTHGGAVTRAAALMMPNLPPGPLDLVIEWGRGDITTLLKVAHDGRDGPGEFLVVKVHQIVELYIVTFNDA